MTARYNALVEPIISDRRRDGMALMFLALVAAILVGDVLVGGQRFFIRDLTRFYVPTKKVVREIVLGGSFPYWNPYYAAGQPLAANPEYEVFYPPQWLIFLPDYDLGFRLHIVFHLVLGCSGMYLLLRSRRVSIAAGLLGAISFGLGGFFFSLVNLLPILFCVAWIPWVVLFVRRFLLHPNRRDFSLAALCGGMQILAGEPTTLVQTWTLIGIYGLSRGWSGEAQGRALRLARTAGLVSLLLVGAVLVGLVQLLPAIDHVGDSVRSRGFDYQLVTAWSMPPWKPLELIFPQLFGHIEAGGRTLYWAGSSSYPGQGSPFIFNSYFGLLPLALVVGGIASRSRGSVWLLAIVGFSALLALGRHTPLFRLLYEAGIAQSVRYPEKFWLVGWLALVLFGALMFDRISSGDTKPLRFATIFSLVVTVVAGGMLALSYTSIFPELFHRTWGTGKSPNADVMIQLARTDWLVAAARAATTTVLLWFGGRWGSRKLWRAGCIAFLIVDLAPVGFDVSPRVDASLFSRPEIVESLDEPKSDYRVFHEVDWYGRSKTARRYFSTGEAVYWIVRNGLYPMTTAEWGHRTVLERDYDKTELLPTVDLVDAMWKVRDGGQKRWREIFMSMSNAWYRSEYRDFQEEKKRVDGAWKTAQPVRFVREGSAPRIYFATELVTIRDRQEFIDRLTEERFDPRVAFVRRPHLDVVEGNVLGVKEAPNRIEIDVESPGIGFLVITTTPHKYWRARIDGAPAVLHVANIGYQGLVVREGRHRIELRYVNPLVNAGALVSLLATIAFALLALGIRSTSWRGWKGRLFVE